MNSSSSGELVPEGGRVVHDFADDDRADERRGIGGAQAGAEFSHRAGLVHAESAGAERDKVHAHTGGIAPQRNPVGGGVKGLAQPVAGEILRAIGFREINAVAVRGIEREERGRVRFSVRRSELILIKHLEAAGGDRGACIRDAVALEVALAVAQKPAAEIHRVGGGVEQLHGILQWRVGVGENFIDD